MAQEIRSLDKSYGYLQSGNIYKVIKTFSDYDRVVYDLGYVFEFIGSSFSPYEDGLSLFCKCNGVDNQIRLQVRPAEQKMIANNLELYFELLPK